MEWQPNLQAKQQELSVCSRFVLWENRIITLALPLVPRNRDVTKLYFLLTSCIIIKAHYLPMRLGPGAL